MSVLNWLFGNNKKKEIKKEVVINRQNLNRVPKYTSYNDDYERVKRKDNSSSIIEDAAVGMAVNSIFTSNDTSPNYSSYNSDSSSSGFCSGFGGGDYSGGGSSGDWGSGSDSSSSGND